jgi:ParB family chromosome partitioning protein
VARGRLGRGLASLIGDVGGEAAHLERPRAQRKVPIEFLKPNPRNPRRSFSDAELRALLTSSTACCSRRQSPGQPFEIIAGERAGASQIGAARSADRAVDVSDSDALDTIIENVQREDLNALEEARGYHALSSGENAAGRDHKCGSRVANRRCFSTKA